VVHEARLHRGRCELPRETRAALRSAERLMAAGVRLRQAVVAARDLDAVAGRLREGFGLLEPFEDPGVGAFGLRNAVFAIGDTFLEAVSPKLEGTTAGRYIEGHGGDCGYMVIFQFDDLEAARKRADALGVRVVWRA